MMFDDRRADWRARPPTDVDRLDPDELVGVSFHWIGPGRGIGVSRPHADCLDQVREWQRQHQAKGWKDVGYGGFVCQHARAIEGRGVLVEGSHSPGVNEPPGAHFGLQFMVGADGAEVSPAMFARAVLLVAEIDELPGVKLGRFWTHADDPEAATSCPGPQITRWVRAGGPTTTGGTMSTPREVSTDVLGWATIPADRIPFGDARETVSARVALGYTMLWMHETRDAVARVESLLRASVEAGGRLTAAEVEAALDRALDRRISDARVELTVDPLGPADGIAAGPNPA